MDVRRLLEERYCPAVVVVASPEAEALCAKNSMSAIQLLKPFARATQDVYSRGLSSGEPTGIRNFVIRLFRPDNVKEVEPRVRTEHFSQLMRDAWPAENQRTALFDDALDAALATPEEGTTQPRLNTKLNTALVAAAFPPWHEHMIRDYFHFVRCSYFDTFDHPVASFHVLCALSGTGVSPQSNDLVRQAQLVHSLPDATRAGMVGMEPISCVVYFVLYDAVDGPTKALLEEQVRRLATAVGSPSGLGVTPPILLVRLNSNAQGDTVHLVDGQKWIDASPQTDVYSTDGTGRRFPRPAPSLVVLEQQQQQQQSVDASSPAKAVFTIRVGHRLTEEDCRELQTAMNSAIVTVVVPHLERRLRALAAFVTENRQGTFSKVASWFRSGDSKATEQGKVKKDPFVPSPTGHKDAHYLHDSLEMQMRRAADFAFFLHDYDNATTYYKMTRDDLQATLSSQKRLFNTSYVAACLEGIGLCHFFQGRLPLPSLPSDVKKEDNRIEASRDAYNQSDVFSYGFRLSLLLYAWARYRVLPAQMRALAVVEHALGGAVRANCVYAATLNDFAACCVLVVNPPHCATTVGMTVPAPYPLQSRFRSYAQFRSIAGHLFLSADILEHAAASLRRALRVFRAVGGHKWPSICESISLMSSGVSFRVGNTANGLANLLVPAAMGTSAFASPQWALNSVEGLMAHIGSFASSHRLALLPFLPLPALLPHRAVLTNIYAEDDVTTWVASRIARGLVNREWAAMEEGLIAHCSRHHKGFSFEGPLHGTTTQKKARSAWASRTRDGLGSAFHECRLGSSVTLSLVLRNPLGVSLLIEDLALLYRRSTEDGDCAPVLVAPPASEASFSSPATARRVPAPNETGTTNAQTATESEESVGGSVGAGGVVVATLPPQTSTIARLMFCPESVGSYDIVGIQWRLTAAGGVVARRYFRHDPSTQAVDALFLLALDEEERHDQQKQQQQQRSSDSSATPTTTNAGTTNMTGSIRIVAVPGGSTLSLDLDPPLPSHMLHGQMHRTALVISNAAAAAVAAGHIALQVSAENSHLLHIGHETLGCLVSPEGTISFPGLTVAPGSAIRVPVTFRAQFGVPPVTALTPTSSQYNAGAGGCFNFVVVMASYADATVPSVPASPTACDAATPTYGCSPVAGAGAPLTQGITIRQSKLIRRIAVRPSLHVFTRALPPPSQAIGHVVSLSCTNAVSKSMPPLRLVSVEAAATGWSVVALGKEELTADGAVDCMMRSDDRVSVTLSATRRGTAGCNSRGAEREDFLCLSPAETLPPSRRELFTNGVGHGFASNAMLWHFALCGALGGAGGIGLQEELVEGTEAFSLYLDKGASNKRKKDEAAAAAAASSTLTTAAGSDGVEEPTGSPVCDVATPVQPDEPTPVASTHFVPLMLAIGWWCEDPASQCVAFGVVFQPVDCVNVSPISVQATAKASAVAAATAIPVTPSLSAQFQRGGSSHALSSSITASAAAAASAAASSSSFSSSAAFPSTASTATSSSPAAAAAAAMLFRPPPALPTPTLRAILEGVSTRTTPFPSRGVVALFVRCPPILRGGLGAGGFALQEVVVGVANYSVVAVDVSLTAGSLLQGGAAQYCGRTKTQLQGILPDAVRYVSFQLQVFAPATLNVNVFDVAASVSRDTALVAPEAQSTVRRITIVGHDIPCLLRSVHDARVEAAGAVGLGGAASPSPQRPQMGRARTISRIGAGGVTVPVIAGGAPGSSLSMTGVAPRFPPKAASHATSHVPVAQEAALLPQQRSLTDASVTALPVGAGTSAPAGVDFGLPAPHPSVGSQPTAAAAAAATLDAIFGDVPRISHSSAITQDGWSGVGAEAGRATVVVDEPHDTTTAPASEAAVAGSRNDGSDEVLVCAIDKDTGVGEGVIVEEDSNGDDDDLSATSSTDERRRGDVARLTSGLHFLPGSTMMGTVGGVDIDFGGDETTVDDPLRTEGAGGGCGDMACEESHVVGAVPISSAKALGMSLLVAEHGTGTQADDFAAAATFSTAEDEGGAGTSRKRTAGMFDSEPSSDEDDRPGTKDVASDAPAATSDSQAVTGLVDDQQ